MFVVVVVGKLKKEKKKICFFELNLPHQTLKLWLIMLIIKLLTLVLWIILNVNSLKISTNSKNMFLRSEKTNLSK